MDEIENKVFEPDFLNILDEQDSTLILGATDDTGGCTAYCETYDPTCRAFKCDPNTCTCNGTCYSDAVCGTDTCGDPTKATCYKDVQPCTIDCGADCPTNCPSNCGQYTPSVTYYWWAAGRISKYGYYLTDKSEYYMLDSARSKFVNGVSASSQYYSSICMTLTANSANVNRIKGTGKTNFYTSGTASTIVGTTADTDTIIGYVFVTSSATTHMSETSAIKVYAESTSSQTYFQNSMWPIITATTGSIPYKTNSYVPEKTFTISVRSGSTPVQGAFVGITNLIELFPQFGYIDATKRLLRTGTEGLIRLCTSSTTSTTITGTASRKGLNGGNNVSFTATQNVATIAQLGQTPTSADNETITIRNAKEIIPEGLLHIANTNSELNITSSFLGGIDMSTSTFNGSYGIYEVLTFKRVSKIEPAALYFTNDPVLGKGTQTTYYATGKTLNSSLQTYAQLSWMTGDSLEIYTPIINNTTTGTVHVVFWCTVDSVDYTLANLEINASSTGKTSTYVSWYHLTGQYIIGGGDSKTVYLKASLLENVSTVSVVAGNYVYVIRSSGNNQ